MTDTVNVPQDPTEEMLVAGARAVEDFYSCGGPYPRTKAMYRAMLAAAPKAEPVSDPDKLEPLLWSMHVLGPDDVYPAPDLATAFKWCEYVNSELAPRTPDVLCAAIPALWYGTAEQHAKSLPEAIKGWTVPAQPEAPKVEQEPVAWRFRWRGEAGPREWRWAFSRRDAFAAEMRGYEVRPVFDHPAPSSELLEALEPLVGCLSIFPYDLDEGDDEEITVELTRRELKRIFDASGIDPHTGNAIAKHKGPQS